MSYVEERAETMNKWKLKVDSETITIIEESKDFFTVHTDHWNDNIVNTLWFPTYQSARKYIREEMHIKGRFKKINKKVDKCQK